MDYLGGFLRSMCDRDRVMLIAHKKIPVGWLVYFILRTSEEVDQFHKRQMWSTPLDYPEGTIAYIDKMVCQDWCLESRKGVEKLLIESHPQLLYHAWYRPTKGVDRLAKRS